MANRFWRGGSGDWNDTSHWSTTSGGSGEASVPTQNDNVFFDANSATSDYTVNLTRSPSCFCKNLDSSANTRKLTLGGSNHYLNIFGNISLSNTQFSWGSTQIQRVANVSLSMDAASRLGFYSFYGPGALSIQSDLYATSFQFISATMNLGTYSIDARDVGFGAFGAQAPRNVHLGSSMIRVQHWRVSGGGSVNLNAGTSQIYLTGNWTSGSSGGSFSPGGASYNYVKFIGSHWGTPLLGDSSSSFAEISSGSFKTLEIEGGLQVRAGSTQTITNLIANGTSSNQIVLRSSIAGSRFTFRKTSGTVNAQYLDLKDSAATGGATWNANSSVNSGNNTGWNFIGPVQPTASFTVAPSSGRAPLAVQFTDTSLGQPDTWNWNFGDGTTSTLQNPTKTYTQPGTYTVSLNAQNALGGSSTTRTVVATRTVVQPAGINANTSAGGNPTITTGGVVTSPGSALSDTTIAGSPTIQPGTVTLAMGPGEDAAADETGTPTITQSPPPPPPPTDWEAIGKEDEKVFIYKVYSPDGQFMSVWTDVKDDPQYTQQLNTPGTTMTVQLARSPNTTKEVRANLITEDGDPILTEEGQRLAVTYETNNNVGIDTDVDLNLNVDVYVHYGEYGYLLNQDGEPITTEDGEKLLVASGAPMGVRVFSGFVLDYESIYGEETGVTVTLASHGYELSHELIRNGETVNVNYSAQDHAAVIKSILDTNPGRMTYDGESIQSTGQNVSAKFQLNTKLEGIKSVFEQTPDGWYWFGNPADNLVYLRQRSATPRHTFIKGKHIKSMRLKRTMEGLTNRVYFVGGEKVEGNPATTLFKKYQDTDSQAQWRVGLERITDRRYTLDSSAENRSTKLINSQSQPVFTTPVTISSARYDLESIKLGDMVGFANFGNFVDSVVLQIVALTYTPTAVTLELGAVLERQVDSVAEIESDLSNEQYQKIPDQPS